jgi:hypothetical protein
MPTRRRNSFAGSGPAHLAWRSNKIQSTTEFETTVLFRGRKKSPQLPWFFRQADMLLVAKNVTILRRSWL